MDFCRHLPIAIYKEIYKKPLTASCTAFITHFCPNTTYQLQSTKNDPWNKINENQWMPQQPTPLTVPPRRRADPGAAGQWGLPSEWGPPAAAPLAGPPGVHPQPCGGGPDLGRHRPHPATLRPPPLLGAGRHTPQHETTGVCVCVCVCVHICGKVEEWQHARTP